MKKTYGPDVNHQRGVADVTPLIASMAIHIRIDPFFGTRIECRNRGDFG